MTQQDIAMACLLLSNYCLRQYYSGSESDLDYQVELLDIYQFQVKYDLLASGDTLSVDVFCNVVTTAAAVAGKRFKKGKEKARETVFIYF